MDRRLPPTRSARPWLLAGGLLVAVAGGTYWSFGGSPTALSVPADELDIATVRRGPFREYINVSGTVAPATSVLIDCRLPGNVEEVYVRDGDRVRAGDTLLRLTNADLELDVLQRESQLLEQLNTQRQTALLLDQDVRRRREQLAEVDYQLELDAPQLVRTRLLHAEGLVADQELEPVVARVAFQERRRELLAAANREDSLVRARQRRQLSSGERRLLDNLTAVRGILGRLYVTAPISGRLVDFDVQPGQRLAEGQRLGQLYRLDAPKLDARVDEYYLPEIAVGQRGVVLRGGDSVAVAVERVYPSVEGGQFRVRLGLASARDSLPGVVLGQAVRARLLFGASAPALLLPTGDFYNDSGGAWVYVLDGAGQAQRRDIRLGRRTPLAHEVLSGLAPGDRVVTSGYARFDDYATIKLQSP